MTNSVILIVSQYEKELELIQWKQIVIFVGKYLVSVIKFNMYYFLIDLSCCDSAGFKGNYETN